MISIIQIKITFKICKENPDFCDFLKNEIFEIF